MSPLISRATDNLALLFSTQVVSANIPIENFEYTIELFGEGFGNTFYNTGTVGNIIGGSYTLSPLTGSGGGYTKLEMISRTSSQISFEPKLYLGGFREVPFNRTVDNLNIGSPNTSDFGTLDSDTTGVTQAGSSSGAGVNLSFITYVASAGDGAAFSIDGQWMGIAGGGTVSYATYTSVATNRATGGTPPSEFKDTSSLTVITPLNLTNPLAFGQGGVNFSSPSATPSSGQNQTVGQENKLTKNYSSPGDGPDITTTQTQGGAGGGGAPGGGAADNFNPSSGGGGNIRIWADTAGVNGLPSGQTSGNITSVPGTSMNLVGDRDGTEVGSSVVKISSTNTGLGISYTSNTNMSLRELKALLDPDLEFAFDIELYGEGIGETQLLDLVNQIGGSPPGTVVTNNSGRGGYTKLRMIVPSSASEMSFEPKKYTGGISTTTRTEFFGAGTFINDYEFGKAGDAAAFSIDGEWMAVAGGSGQIYYSVDSSFNVGTSATTKTHTIISSPSIFGRGGVNTLVPTASPTVGQSKINTGAYNYVGSIQSGLEYRGGSGGGGSAGGPAYTGPDAGPASTAPSGGAGNIRIYEQTGGSSDDGNFTLPGIDPIYMRLEDSSDNFWDGPSKVVISHPVTGASLEFTSNTTISIRELKAILIPTQELAFEIELFGAGGVDDTYTTYAFQNAPPYTPGPSFTAPNTRGGYTKLKMIIPVSNTDTIDLQPALYGGGVQAIPFSIGGIPSASGTWTTETSPFPAGYNAAAFSVNGEWMAIAGGGTRTFLFENAKDQVVFPGFYERSYFGIVNVSSTDVGRGGVNSSNPTAAPSRGANQTSGSYSYSPGGGLPGGAGAYSETNQPIGGGGGGGAPGGTAVDTSLATPSTAGEGNIRIWADTVGVSSEGDLTSVSGVYMKLLDSQDGYPLPTNFFGTPIDRNSTIVVTGIGTSKTITKTGADITYTTAEFRNLLFPGVFN